MPRLNSLGVLVLEKYFWKRYNRLLPNWDISGIQKQRCMSKNTETIEDSKQLEHLQRLLLFTPPEDLRKSIQKTLFAYLLEQDTEAIPEDFKQVVENHFFLIDFLDKLEQNKTA